MGCPVVLECCFENISIGKALRALVIFIVSFLLIFCYLNLSEFTAWTTALWTGFLIALVYTIGIVCNVYCRCAALVFFVHLFFSKFGLLMMFVSSSWMTLQIGLGAFRKNQKLENKILMELDDEDLWNPNLAFVDDILGTIHYFSLLPYLCNFLYSLLYEVTYECRRIERRSGEDPHGTLFHLCVRLFKYLICVMVGGCALLILGIYLCQWHTYENLVMKFENKGKDPSVLIPNPKGWIIFYLVFCTTLIVLSTFSRYLIKFRKTIIRNYFDFTPRNVRTRARHNYITKPAKKRMTLKEYKMRYKASSKLSRKPSNDQLSSDDNNDNCVLDVKEQEAVYRKKQDVDNASPFFVRKHPRTKNCDKLDGITMPQKKSKKQSVHFNDENGCTLKNHDKQVKYFVDQEVRDKASNCHRLETVSKFVDEDDDNIALRLERVRSKVQFDTSSESDEPTEYN